MAERTQFARMKIPKGSDLLAEQIRSAILIGELEKGDMLPSEKELMSQMGLSRATVREGLRLLEAQGLITTRPGRGGGATVQRPNHLGHTRSLATLLQLDGVTLNELFEAWSTIVPVCGRLAAMHITPAQLTYLHDHIDYMSTSLDDHHTFTALEVRFHMLIAHATNNAVLRIYGTSLAEITFQQIREVPFTSEEMEAGLAACQAILASIETGDGRRVERRIARHLAAVRAGIIRLAASWAHMPAEVSGTMDHLTGMANPT